MRRLATTGVARAAVASAGAEIDASRHAWSTVPMFEGFDDRPIEVAPGVALQVRTAGTGTPVVLLHGYPQHGVCWHRVAPDLAEHHAVVVPDLRGYGRSSTPPDDAHHTTYSKRTMANDIVAVMGALGHDGFAVVGHDRGGRVAYRLAPHHPPRGNRPLTPAILA